MPSFRNIESWESEAVFKTYNKIRLSLPEFNPDSLKVVKTVINHRNFWKPPRVKTLLLAESHVYTSDSECANELKYPDLDGFKGLPDKFVRLVYCLGYGEGDLAPDIEDNAGTWQYWQIFAACAADSAKFDFSPYQKKGNKPYIERLKNKLALLRKLVEKGIWLVDSSIVALYGYDEKPKQEFRQKAIAISWEYYISNLIKRIKPETAILIGSDVAAALGGKLDDMGIKYEKLSQPQKGMSSGEIKKTHLKYQKICNRG